jgi:hypothetical protein
VNSQKTRNWRESSVWWNQNSLPCGLAMRQNLLAARIHHYAKDSGSKRLRKMSNYLAQN